MGVERIMRPRRVELACGIAAALLTLLALAMLLFAPVIPVCPRGAATCTTSDVIFVTLTSTSVSPGAAAYIIGLCVVLLLGAVAAALDALTSRRAAAVGLWAVAALALAGCAVAAQGLGALYVPAVLALVIAAFVSIRRSIRPPRPRPATFDTLERQRGDM